MQLALVPGESVHSPEPEPPPEPQETSAERRKRKEREREKGRVRSRAKVPGRSRGRPPNSSYTQVELKDAKDRRVRLEREAADARWAECCARAAADDKYAQDRGFSDASSYRDARHFELLPCGHRSNRPPQVGLTLCAETDRAGLCDMPLCGRAYGEFRAAAAVAEEYVPVVRPQPVRRSSGLGHTPVRIGGVLYRACAFCSMPGQAFGRADADGQWYCKQCWREWDPAVPSCELDCSCRDCRDERVAPPAVPVAVAGAVRVLCAMTRTAC